MMNNPYIYSAIGGAVGVAITALFGWISNRKKNTADARKIEAEANDHAFKSYEILLDNHEKRFDRMTRKIEALESEIREMRKHVCNRANCPHRHR